MKHTLTHAEANVRLIRAGLKILDVSDDTIIKTPTGSVTVKNISTDLSVDMISNLRKFLKERGVGSSFDNQNDYIMLVFKFETPIDENED